MSEIMLKRQRRLVRLRLNADRRRTVRRRRSRSGYAQRHRPSRRNRGKKAALHRVQHSLEEGVLLFARLQIRV